MMKNTKPRGVRELRKDFARLRNYVCPDARELQLELRRFFAMMPGRDYGTGKQQSRTDFFYRALLDPSSTMPESRQGTVARLEAQLANIPSRLEAALREVERVEAVRRTMGERRTAIHRRIERIKKDEDHWWWGLTARTREKIDRLESSMPMVPFSDDYVRAVHLLPEVLQRLEIELQWQLSEFNKYEASKRRRRAEEARQARIVASAAAHFGETRELADEVRKTLFDQLHHFPLCPYCQGPLGDTPHADHIYPVAKGGLSTPQNMVLVCAACNLKKAAKTLREFAKQEKLNWSAIEESLEKLGKQF